MKELLTILLFPILLFTGCSESSPGNIDEPDLGLTAENLKGTWETYYFSKKIETQGYRPLEMRYPEIDGTTLNFLDESRCYETNARGDKLLSGTYKVINKSQIKFTFEDNQGNEEESIRNVLNISKRKLSTRSIYGVDTSGVKITVTDTKVFRNLERAPNITEGVPKEMVQMSKLKGSWELTKYTKRENNNTEVIDSVNGMWYTFTDTADALYDGSYKEYTADGSLATEGSIVIVDDVIHLFVIGEVKSGGVSKEITKEAFMLWVRDWGMKTDNGVQREGYQVYDRYVTFTESGVPGTYESVMELRRKQ